MSGLRPWLRGSMGTAAQYITLDRHVFQVLSSFISGAKT